MTEHELAVRLDSLNRKCDRILNEFDFANASITSPTPDRMGAMELQHVLVHEGKAFVTMAYLALLNRLPDPDGEKHFIDALATGAAKLDILRTIRTSPEGMGISAELAGFAYKTSLNVGSQRIVVVLGMHRSGTSALTRGLEVLGVDLGENLHAPRPEENAKGYFEDADITVFNDAMLTHLGTHWHNLMQFESAQIRAVHQAGFFNRAVDLLRAKIEKKPIFGLKDPRLCKLLTFWQDIFAQCNLAASYVIAVRNPLSVVSSLHKRNGFPRSKCYAMWLDHTLNSLALSAGCERVVIDFDQLLAAPDSVMKNIAKSMRLRFEPGKMGEYSGSFLDVELRHGAFSLEELRADVLCPPIVAEVYATLRDMALAHIELNTAEFSNRLLIWKAEFDVLKRYFSWID